MYNKEYLNKIHEANEVLRTNEEYCSKVIKRVEEIIKQLETLGTPTTERNITLQSLFSTGGTIDKFDMLIYTQRKTK